MVFLLICPSPPREHISTRNDVLKGEASDLPACNRRCSMESLAWVLWWRVDCHAPFHRTFAAAQRKWSAFMKPTQQNWLCFCYCRTPHTALLLLKHPGIKGLMGIMFSDTAMIQIIASMMRSRQIPIASSYYHLLSLYREFSEQTAAICFDKILGI